MAIIPVSSTPGVQRDGTLFAGGAYSSAEWTRFYLDKPRKIRGCREISRSFAGVGRGMHVDTVNGSSYVHVGESSLLERVSLDTFTGACTGVVSRTPVGFVGDPNMAWQFDSEWDAGTNANYLLAHAAPNLADIANNTTGPLYFGSTTGTAALTAVTNSSVSGGVVVLHPFAVIFGSDGYLAWSNTGDPTNFTGGVANSARPTAKKIVRGIPLRTGPGNSPAGLFWGLDTLSRLYYIGGAGSGLFGFDTITTSSSILSPASMIEHNGVYYWLSRGGFLMFNGTIQDIENTYNKTWFYKNINMEHAQKAYATKVPLFNEIWWCFPKGTSTECNHAIVYSYKKGYWYDTPLLDDGRSCAYFEQVFPYPLMMDAGTNSSDRYSLWQHEYGVNKVGGLPAQDLAIRAKFRTNQISVIMPAQGPGTDRSLSVSLVEPDFEQVGDMVVRLFGAPNATVKEPPQVSDDVPLFDPANSDGGAEYQPAFTVTERLLQFEFESNVADGDFQMGNTLAHVEDGDDRRTS